MIGAPPSPRARARAFAVALAVLATATGLGARALLAGPIAKILGDACWALDVYALVRFLGPGRPVRVTAALTLLISFAVELLQLTSLPASLSSRHVLLRMLLGSDFHATDLLWYLLAVVAATAADRKIT
jgi:hypothetical protein